MKPITWLDAVGGMFILLAVFTISQGERAKQVTKRMYWLGIAYCTSAMLCTSIGVVMIKPVYTNTPVLWANMFRLLFSVLFLALLCGVKQLWFRKIRKQLDDNSWAQLWSGFRWGAHMKYMIPGVFFGTYLVLFFWIAGMKYTLVGVSALLNQLSTVFIMLLAIIFLKEKFTLIKCTALILALGGAYLVVI